MQTILLAWNPEKFKWGDLQDELTSVKNKDSKHNRWSVGNARHAVKNGDRFFLVRLGSAPTGIVANGSIISAPYEAPHWNGAGGVALYVDIVFEHLNETPVISWEELQESPLSEFRWGIQQSGVRVPSPIAEELTTLFKKRVNKSKYPFTAHSWSILSERVAVKEMDKSAFLHHGTGVPKEIASFFDLPEEGLLKALPINLKIGEANYSAHIEMDAPYARFRLFWKSDLSGLIKKRFPEIHRAFKSDDTDVKAPHMSFARLEKNSYSVSFVNLPVASPETEEALIKEFERQVADAKKDTSAKRRQRLSKAETKPQAVPVLTTAYKRNPDVVAEVLARANGICELCNNPAPFVRKKDGEPYLEVHHKIQLANGGEDTVENAVAACPNCHRQEHFGV